MKQNQNPENLPEMKHFRVEMPTGKYSPEPAMVKECHRLLRLYAKVGFNINVVSVLTAAPVEGNAGSYHLLFLDAREAGSVDEFVERFARSITGDTKWNIVELPTPEFHRQCRNAQRNLPSLSLGIGNKADIIQLVHHAITTDSNFMPDPEELGKDEDDEDNVQD